MAKGLTAASVEKLSANPDKRVEIPDGLLAGLYLVIQPSGRKSWAVRYRSDGATRKLTLGPYPALDLGAARDAARKALRDAQTGADPARDKQIARKEAKERGEDDRDAFPAVARLFIERHAKPNNRRWKDTARILGLIPDPTKPDDAEKPKTFIPAKKGIASRWQQRRVQEITRRDIIDLLDEMVEADKPIAANRALAALRKLFNWAAGRDIIVANPAAGLKAPAAETARDRVLSDDELRALWKASDELAWPMGRFVQALILTGQRRDEVAGMTRRELSMSSSMWTIPRARAKNDMAHDVPLSKASLQLLESLPTISGDAGYIFTTTGETPISGFSKAKIKLDEKMLAILQHEAADRGEDPRLVTLPAWRLHDARRTVATGMAKLGINLPVIEKVLNHQSGTFAGIVGVYQRHSFAEEKRRALDAWASFVETLVTDRPKDNVTTLRSGEAR